MPTFEISIPADSDAWLGRQTDKLVYKVRSRSCDRHRGWPVFIDRWLPHILSIRGAVSQLQQREMHCAHELQAEVVRHFDASVFKVAALPKSPILMRPLSGLQPRRSG